MNHSVNVSIIIVNFNTRDLLRNCLKSVYEKTQGISFEVIVSDNGSVDGSVEMLKEEFPQVVLVENKANIGFGSGNNRGLAVAKGEFIFYLNSDTLLLNNAVRLFYDYWMEHKNEGLGVLGCNLVDAENQLTMSYGKFPTVGFEFHHLWHSFLAFWIKNVLKLFNRDISSLRAKPKYAYFEGDVDFVIGADMFLKNDERALFDEKFFLYYEETDLQRKMANVGLIRRIIPGPQVVHLVKGGGKRADDVVQYGSFSMIQSEISRVRYMKMHVSKVLAFFTKLAILFRWISPYIIKKTKPHFSKLMGV